MTDFTATITASIPARVTKHFRTGARQVLPARVETFTADAEGRWTLTTDGLNEPVSEAEVIDVCTKASNWPQIKAAHFPMHGFHA